jgi:pimeloyl-ACP methyl ester carboxylesterase
VKKYIVVTLLLIFAACSNDHYYHRAVTEFADLDYHYSVSYVQVRNIRVAMLDEGQGEQTLILIHGLGSNAKAWLRNIPVWAEKYRVLALDLPGYFKSDKGYYPYSMDFYATVLIELMDSLSLDKAVFVGHSMGGQIAMTAALDYPQRVSQLVLVSTAGFETFSEGEADWFRKVMTVELVRDTPIRSIATNLHNNFYAMPEAADFMITDRIAVRQAEGFEDYCYAVVRNVSAMVDAPVHDRLGDIRQPTLIIFGEQDALIPNPYLHGGFTSDIAAIGADLIPNNELLLIPACGHFAQFEKPEVVNQAVISFLDR